MRDSDSTPVPDPLEAVLAASLNTVVFHRSGEAQLLPRLDFVASYLDGVKEPIHEASLLYRGENSTIRAVPIRNCLRFGRAKECEISMPGFREISRVHFTISEDRGGYFLTDHHSANGTYVRGVSGRVNTRELLNGDIIDVCDFAFVFIRE